MVLMTNPPKLVYDESGRLIEVILTAGDYLAYLRSIVDEMDWESLPVHLQDAIDRMLIDDVRNEKDTAVDLGTILADDA